MSMNVLITGGAGFVGSNLAVYLKNKFKDHNIICFDNLTRSGSELNAQRLKDLGVHIVKGDVRDKRQLFDLENISLIIECSAEPSVLASYEDPDYTIDTNLIGAINCLELAQRDQAKFIFLSTSRVYPIEPLNDIPFNELPTRFDIQQDAKGVGFSYQGVDVDFSTTGVKSLYGATKLSAEHLIQEFLDMYSLKGVINRFGVIAGPWQMGKVDQGIVGFWVAQHKYQKPLNYIGYKGSGKQVRDVIHIDDVCDLIFKQINCLDDINGKVFNVGGGRNNACSLFELTEKVKQITKKSVPINSVDQERKADVRIYITDNAYLEKHMGWQPSKSLDDVIIDINSWIDGYAVQLENILT